jgi:hypothetical protein
VRGRNLVDFQSQMSRAMKYGVGDEFLRLFKVLRRKGFEPHDASEMAMREAVLRLNPRARIGVTVVQKEGSA